MNTAFVWVGTFSNEREFKKYADHNATKCPFRDDYPIGYDAASYIETFRAPEESLRQAMVRLFYSAGYLDAVLEKLKRKKDAGKVNAVKVVFLRTKGVKKVDSTNWATVKSPLRFVGAFEYGDSVPLRHPDLKDGIALQQKGWVSVWIGSAADRKSAEAYMEEEYDEDAPDDQPLSQFGRDWRLSYDHDFLFHEAYAAPQPVAKLLGGWPAAKSFAKPAAAAAKSAGIAKGNLVVVAYDLDYSVKPPFYTVDAAGYWRHKGKPKANTPLAFVGAFPYSDD